MRVTILGCGGSGGVPLVGNHWGSCNPKNPRNRRRRVSVLIEDHDRTILIDASPDCRMQLLDANVRKLDAVLFTHDHADHAHGIDDLRFVRRDPTAPPLPVFGTAETLETLSHRFDYAFSQNEKGSGRLYRPFLAPTEIRHGQPFDLLGLTVVPYRQEHGHGTLSTGYRVGPMAYSTDVVELPPASLAQLATHLQQVREDERGHLARELHDELGALLTAAKLDVARLKSRLGSQPPEVLERMQHLTETLNSGIALKRRIIEDLRPSSLANLGLIAALEILAREFSERSGLDVTSSLEPVDLDESAQLTVYRIVQESLTNVGKYAEASRVEIGLLDLRNHIELEVRDDGRGFDVRETRPSTHGLAGMRHRVEAAGGRLTVESSPGAGTRITAALPKVSAQVALAA